MPIIDSKSDSKFDALIRTKKADSLMSLIMATRNVKGEKDRKEQVALRLKSAFDLFREDKRGMNSGAGTYGDGSRDIMEQFESQYTMGYEMGIWYDSDYHLNRLANKVSKYEFTINEYIGIVFLNLFCFYFKNGRETYHHFLYEILMKMKQSGEDTRVVTNEMIVESLPPIDKRAEQGKILFNYLLDTDLFDKVDNETLVLSNKWDGRLDTLIHLCNREHESLNILEAKEIFKNKKTYSDYVTKIPEFDLRYDPHVIDSSYEFDDSSRVSGGCNVLLYGVPGAGKSWTIKRDYCNDEERMMRVVFHPDYTYSDFVGQILPKVDQNMILYEFCPGPFTKIMKKAYENPDKMYFLIIEEINRGNAPSIFGDIFQLLDRTKIVGSDSGIVPQGTSEYSISNSDIAKIVYEDYTKKVRIPSNMSIIATMNTSDQNVFTLDTAFQRRWNMRMIPNNFDHVDSNFANKTILDTMVTWKRFCTLMNRVLLDNNVQISSSEDKRLGVYFVDQDDLVYNENQDSSEILGNDGLNLKYANRNFAEKVIKYLWDDAFKYSRDDIFEVSNFNSLEEVIEAFMSATGNDRFKIFNDSVYNNLISVENSIYGPQK